MEKILRKQFNICLYSVNPAPSDYLTIERVLIEDKYQNVEDNDKLLIAKYFMMV